MLIRNRNHIGSKGSARLFLSAASGYWAGVFPTAHGAKRRLLERAQLIPDPVLRGAALDSHRDKGANSEGLAALAVLAPREKRTDVARSLVAYQLMLDYLDGVSEAPSANPMENGLCLHRAFEVALDPGAEHVDYYEHSIAKEDGGYLFALIDACRAPLVGLPGYQVVRGRLLRQALLCRESQALNHAQRFVSLQDQVDGWAARTAAESELDPGFEWWELIAAAAASSLCVGALLALAAMPGITAEDAERVEDAYFPWASGLNALLDSLVDLDEDPDGGSHLRRYESREVAAERLSAIAAGARKRLAALPDGALHEAILAAMGALYLIHEEAWQPDREPISRAVYSALGPLAWPSMGIHWVRRRGRGGGALLAARRHPLITDRTTS